MTPFKDTLATYRDLSDRDKHIVELCHHLITTAPTTEHALALLWGALATMSETGYARGISDAHVAKTNEA